MCNVAPYYGGWQLEIVVLIVLYGLIAASDDTVGNGDLVHGKSVPRPIVSTTLHNEEIPFATLPPTAGKAKIAPSTTSSSVTEKASSTTSTTSAKDDKNSKHKGESTEVVHDDSGAGVHDALMAPVGMKRGHRLHMHSKALSVAEHAAKEASEAHVEAEAAAKAAAKADAVAANKFAEREAAEGEARAEVEAEAKAIAKAKATALKARNIANRVVAEANATATAEQTAQGHKEAVQHAKAEAAAKHELANASMDLKRAEADATKHTAAKAAAEKKLAVAKNATRATEADAKKKAQEKEAAQAKAKAASKAKARAEALAKEEKERQEATAKGKARAEQRHQKEKAKAKMQDEAQDEGRVTDDKQKGGHGADVGDAHETSGEHASISDPVGMKHHFLRHSTTARPTARLTARPTSSAPPTPSPSAGSAKAASSTTETRHISSSSTRHADASASEHQSDALPMKMNRSDQVDQDEEVVVQSPSMALPSHWSRIERSGEFLASPYISQRHLDKLWQFLFTGYYKDVPPVPEDGGPLPVGVGINFVKFKDFDEVSGTINILLNLRLCWDDERLSFNTSDFFGVQWEHGGDKLPVRSGLLWTPDVVVLNEVDNMHDVFQRGSTPLVLVDDAFRKETGVNVLWSRPLDVHSKCNVDMSLYPFDVQRCDIIIGSWAASRRQMSLVTQPFFAEHTVHTSEFQVKDIAVTKRVVYTRAVAQSFTEIVYTLVLERYPHYYVINFILPMVAITLLTISTMWMSLSNIGPRVNSSTKLLLCIVSIMFITARHRPAIHGDIWLDRFQSHCLALSMSAVLESFFVDYLSKMTVHISWFWRVDVIDSLLRTFICAITAVVIFSDACQVDQNSALTLYTSVNIDSTGLLVAFVYIIFFGLGLSSVFSIIWFILPRRLQHQIVGKDEDQSKARHDSFSGYASDGSDPPPMPWPSDIGSVSPREDVSTRKHGGRYSQIPSDRGITSARIQML